MEKVCGVHIYFNVVNLNEIIKGEEEANDEVKRGIHRLHTYFAGLSDVVNHFGGEIEKFSSGRAHIYLAYDDNDEEFWLKVVKTVVAGFRFCYEVFNNLGKYSQYTGFSVQAGADFGDFYTYDITNLDEFTTIGGVANVAAKITSFAAKRNVLVTQDFYKKLPSETKKAFEQLEEQELKEIQEKLKGNPLIYLGAYSDLLDDQQEIDDLLESTRQHCEEIANGLNLKDMQFEDARTKIDFSRLSRNKNKHITAGLLFADLRGFTKLFNVSGSNLDDLAEVLAAVYSGFDEIVTNYGGVRVQFQGDRIVAVFNTYTSENELALIRMFEASLKIKDKIKEISDLYSEKLGGKKLKVGVGLCWGDYYATRLGVKKNKDNLVLGSTVTKGDTAEDKYAEDNEVAVTKEYKDAVSAESKNYAKCQAIEGFLQAINTTGYYKTAISYDDYNQKVESIRSQVEKIAVAALKASTVSAPFRKESSIRPWKS
jgi:class 3 adenylate cyclase